MLKKLKEFFTNRVVLNTIVLFIITFSLEMIVRYLTDSSFKDWGVLRIGISSFLISLIWSWITHFFKKLPARILNIVYVLFAGIYIFAEFGLYNFLGFFMGIGNAEQGTKVLDYIIDFLSSLKPIYYLLIVPTIVGLLYYIIIDRLIMKNKERNQKMNLIQKIYIEVVTLVIILSTCGIYYYTIRNDKLKNDLQTESNYALWIYPENSNLTVNNYGVLMYGFTDIKSIVLDLDSEDVDRLVQMEFEEHTNNNNGNNVVTTPEGEEIDYNRYVDDKAWDLLLKESKSSEYKQLNNYFKNRNITPKNEYTGIFKDKNLIIVMMESTNELSVLNEKDFPTLYKLYNEGISFRNNFSPRNNCSTGNNEFTTLTSMFTINNTCTANTYSSNKYYQSVFGIFSDAGYKTTSYHDYTQKYYRRNKIHTNLGVGKYYGVTDLDMDYDEKYEEWPSDVVMFKQARQYYLGDKFMAYFATVTPHQTYHVPSEFGDKYKDNWKDTKYTTRLKRYLSKLKTLDLALEELLRQLEEEGKLQDTVIALFGDHYPYGLQDSDINMYLEANNAGYTVSRNSTKNKNVDRTPMVIYNSEIEPMQVTEYTTIIDLLPTLLNMFDMEYDPRLYLGTDIMSDSHKSLAVFADGSWQNEFGFYYAPSSKMTYSQKEFKYTNQELKEINTEISTRQKMSTNAIKKNYFNYLNSGIKKYKTQLEKENNTTTTTTTAVVKKEEVTTTIKNESEE